MTGPMATTWSLLYCWPCSVHSFCGTETEILPLQWRQRRAVSLVELQQPRPSSVPWELAAGPVPCSDRRSVSLESVVQSRTEMLQKSALKIRSSAHRMRAITEAIRRRILPEMTISSSVRRHCAHYRQIQIQPQYNRLGMNRFQDQCLGCSIADVGHCTFHFLGGATPPGQVRGGWALLPE